MQGGQPLLKAIAALGGGGDDLFMAQGVGGETGRPVCDQGKGENLHSERSGCDGFGNGGHTHQIRSEKG